MKGTLQLPPQSLHWLALQGDLELCDMVQFAQRALERRGHSRRADIYRAIGLGGSARVAAAFFDLGKAFLFQATNPDQYYSRRQALLPSNAIATARRTLRSLEARHLDRAESVVSRLPRTAIEAKIAAITALSVSAAIEGECGRSDLALCSAKAVIESPEAALSDLLRIQRRGTSPQMLPVLVVAIQRSATETGNLGVAFQVARGLPTSCWAQALDLRALFQLNLVNLSILVSDCRNIQSQVARLADLVSQCPAVVRPVRRSLAISHEGARAAGRRDVARLIQNSLDLFDTLPDSSDRASS